MQPDLRGCPIYKIFPIQFHSSIPINGGKTHATPFTMSMLLGIFILEKFTMAKIPAHTIYHIEENGAQKYRCGLKHMNIEANAQCLPVRSELPSLLRTPLASQCPADSSGVSTLPILDTILDCSVFSWLFDASLSLNAARHPPCCSDRDSPN